jgi:crotonobetainyl-CoA:carnitine CoA-transferase CaiB-like acyl-CoA transferase
MWLNCGKKSVVADLRTEEGIEKVRELASKADVLVENMRPGTLAAKGLGYERLRELNPGLVMCSISAFGATGIFAKRAGQGIVAEGWAGAIDMNGYADQPPVPVGLALADVSAGLHAYSGILTALYRRDTIDGQGDYIDVSLFDATLPFHETALQEVEFGDEDVRPTRNGLEHRAVTPYGVYSAPDGYLVVAATSEALWQRLDRLISDQLGPSAVDLGSNEARLAHNDVVRARIEGWATRMGSRDAALEALNEAGVPSGPIEEVKDVATGPLARSRNSFVSIPDPVRGEVSVLNTPFRMTNANVRPSGPAPRLGEHQAAEIWQDSLTKTSV